MDAQTPGRRSNSDPVPEPSEDPLPYVSHSTSATALSARSDATGRSSSMAAAVSACSSLPSDFGGAAGDQAPSGEPPAERAAADDAAEGLASEAPAAVSRPAEAAAEASMGTPAEPDEAGLKEGGVAAAARPAPAEDAPSSSAGHDGAKDAPPAAATTIQNGREASSRHEVVAAEAGSSGGPTLQASAAAAEALTGAEAEHSPTWQRQPKHVFVLTSAGTGARRYCAPQACQG